MARDDTYGFTTEIPLGLDTAHVLLLRVGIATAGGSIPVVLGDGGFEHIGGKATWMRATPRGDLLVGGYLHRPSPGTAEFTRRASNVQRGLWNRAEILAIGRTRRSGTDDVDLVALKISDKGSGALHLAETPILSPAQEDPQETAAVADQLRRSLRDLHRLHPVTELRADVRRIGLAASGR